ncbi:MAG TPA: DUF3887 domain-containing protein, partial [Thermoanaerobaculia bacterium]|nr:DUF3887 domain-containing protein [Thermoanaerobaculia bacterium]
MPLLASLLLSTFFAINAKPQLPSVQEQSARAMLANFVASRFVAAAAEFNDGLRPQITPALLAQVKDDLSAKVGTFRSVTAVHHLSQDGFRVVELIAKFEKAEVSVRVVFDFENKIGAVYFNPILPPPVDAARFDVCEQITGHGLEFSIDRRRQNRVEVDRTDLVLEVEHDANG